MAQPIITFEKRDEKCETRLALFLAGLVKEGIVFTVASDAYSYEVKLTGGF